jgi:UDP-glucose 4-epimerase
MKKIGITGGAGFIGRYVVEELQSKGYIPIVFDHQRRNKDEFPEDVELFLGDVRDDVAMVEFAAHVDGIIHLAAVLGTQETIKNPRPAAESNLKGGLNFLEACSQYNLPGVYICVGNRGMYNTYSLTKSLIEDFVYMFNKDRGTRINNFRVVNAYGPRQLACFPYGPGKVRKITPAFICRALNGDPVEVYGGGVQVSDMVYVKDVAEGLVLSLEAANQGRIFDKPIEIGPTKHHSVREIAETIIRISQEFGYKEVPITSLPMRPGETPNSFVIAKNETLSFIGMMPEELLSLDDGMRETIRWFHENKGKTWHGK